MRRRPEAYHATLRPSLRRQRPVEGEEAPASIHDIVRIKEPGLAARLFYDASSGAPASSASWPPSDARGLGDRPRRRARRRRRRRIRVETSSPVASSPAARRRQRSVRDGDQDDHSRRRPPRPDPDASRSSSSTARARRRRPRRHRVDADDARRRRQPVRLVGRRRRPDRARRRRQAHDVSTIAQGNDYVGVSVTRPSTPADAWWAPIETVSNSEAGFERVYQGSGLLLSWPLALAPGGRGRARVTTPWPRPATGRRSSA